MIEHAIPTGTSIQKHTTTEYRRSVARLFLLLALFLGSVTLVGCKNRTKAVQGETVKIGEVPHDADSGNGAGGRNVILQMPFDQAAKIVLMNIGMAYKMAAITNNKPPKDAAELDVGPRGLKTQRDMQDHEVEVVYGVNPQRLQGDPADYMIAWEKEPTNDGCRMVLMADFTTVKYVTRAEFEKMKRAK